MYGPPQYLTYKWKSQCRSYLLNLFSQTFGWAFSKVDATLQSEMSLDFIEDLECLSDFYF